MPKKKKEEITIYSSAAEYLTYIAATGDDASSIEMRYEDENIWLTQKMMAQLYDVSIAKNYLDDKEMSYMERIVSLIIKKLKFMERG